ncbi:pre-rRNA processing [Malassezia sp. CBS 17886]|nr:pre-rRNA processing [Malassezia sp. CBS 17886]
MPADVLHAHVPRTAAAVPACIRAVLHECEAGLFDDALCGDGELAHFVGALLQRGAFADARPTPLDAAAEPDGVYALVLPELAAQIRSTASAARLATAYEVLLQLGERTPNVYRWLLYGSGACGTAWALPSLVHRLVHNIWAGHYALRAPAQHAPVGPPLPVPAQSSPPRAPPPGDARTRPVLLLQQHAYTLLYMIMCCVRLRSTELQSVSTLFLEHLFDQLEAARSHADESLSVMATRLIVAVNEQDMIAVQDAPRVAPMGVLHVIRARGHTTQAFAQNVIFMLNRTPSGMPGGCLFHFLVLKLLDELFAVEDTASFFYTNDLRVLADIFLREISALPESRELLRQVYLLVLHALLSQTQLCHERYKEEQVDALLRGMEQSARWHDVSALTLHLVRRCQTEASPNGRTVSAADRAADARARTTSEARLDRLVLGQVQSAAAAAAAPGELHLSFAAVVWPPCDTQDASCATNALDLDVLALGSACGTGACGPDDTAQDAPEHTRSAAPPAADSPATDTRARRRRAPPPRPARRPRGFVSESMPDLGGGSARDARGSLRGDTVSASSVSPPAPSAPPPAPPSAPPSTRVGVWETLRGVWGGGAAGLDARRIRGKRKSDGGATHVRDDGAAPRDPAPGAPAPTAPPTPLPASPSAARRTPPPPPDGLCSPRLASRSPSPTPSTRRRAPPPPPSRRVPPQRT